jgi:hypothetical protein
MYEVQKAHNDWIRITFCHQSWCEALFFRVVFCVFCINHGAKHSSSGSFFVLLIRSIMFNRCLQDMWLTKDQADIQHNEHG